MEKTVDYIISMLIHMLAALPVAALARVLCAGMLKKRGIRSNAWHEAGLLLFAVFSAALAFHTVLPPIGLHNGSDFFAGFGSGEINLVPFRVLTQTYRSVFINGSLNGLLINLLGNIVMFMPIGFLIPLLYRGMKLWNSALWGFLSSLTIELCQLTQERCTDIDDLWLNTLGAVAGYAVFACVERARPGFDLKFKVMKADEFPTKHGQT